MNARPDPRLKLTPFSLQTTADNPLSRNFLQWSVVTPDMDGTCAAIQSAFGAAGFVILENAPIIEAKFHGKDIDLRCDLALGYLGETNVEVIRPSGEGDPNAYSEFLDERPAGGLHHFAFRVYDLPAARAQLEAQFGAAVLEGAFGDDGTRFAYYDTRNANGVFTELICLGPTTERFMEAVRVGNPPTSLG